MLPNHPLLSEASSLNDPHQQWARLSERIREADRHTYERAFLLALRAHASQWRKAARGSVPVPYAVHPVRVARILAEEWNVDEPEPLQTALLHDILEDCPPDRQADYAREIEDVAGAAVLKGVWALTKPLLPAAVPVETKARRDAEYFRVVRTSPSWVRLVKCADRVDNLRDALLWGDRDFWARYSSETIGWHLFLARETAPIAEVALFKILVGGERALNGCVPFWVDGHLVDPVAARAVPEHVARHFGIVGLAQRGDTLVVGSRAPLSPERLAEIRLAISSTGPTFERIEPLSISDEALRDAMAANLFGSVGKGS
jgi:hypothetical protein